MGGSPCSCSSFQIASQPRFFPQQSLTPVEETGQHQRYHIHASLLEEALYVAVRKAKITKKVTAHQFAAAACAQREPPAPPRRRMLLRLLRSGR